ncbi:MAG: hypothetical protein G8345_22240 [Magnetococcales bacterium]|nr:hypothetical protein [Magnetococcales bacterium]
MTTPEELSALLAEKKVIKENLRETKDAIKTAKKFRKDFRKVAKLEHKIAKIKQKLAPKDASDDVTNMDATPD